MNEIPKNIGSTSSTASLTGATSANQNRAAVASHSELFSGLIEAANAAPSADNNQPWKLRPVENGLDVFWDVDRRLPSDVDGMFDLLSIGALIENVVQTLLYNGRSANVSLVNPSLPFELEDDQDPRLVANIAFSKASNHPIGGDLSQYIKQRNTSRIPYLAQTLDAKYVDEIHSVAIQNDRAELKWERDRTKINQIASLVALSDSLRFRYREFHEELHRQLRLTEKHANDTRDGLDYRTLGLPPGGRWVLRAIKKWRTMSGLNRIGMARLLAAPSIRLVRRSGAIGFIYVNDRSPQSLMEGGRAMQRMWLQATKMGLSVHPLGSLPVFLANESMPSELKPTVDRIRGKAIGILPPSKGFLQMAFRIGVCERETKIRSQRRRLDEVTLASSSI